MRQHNHFGGGKDRLKTKASRHWTEETKAHHTV